jgi:hypothetical protein
MAAEMIQNPFHALHYNSNGRGDHFVCQVARSGTRQLYNGLALGQTRLDKSGQYRGPALSHTHGNRKVPGSRRQR